MLILAIVFYVGLCGLAIVTGWFLLLTIGSWCFTAKTDRSAPLKKLGVIIPAHNEALQIRATIENVQRCSYPAELLHIVVLADNSIDQTASLARSTGVTVVERHDSQLPGKGQALNWFLKNCQDSYSHLEGIVFIDADVMPDKDMFKQLSASLAHPDVHVVQGFNGVANPYENWRTALNTAAFNVFNHLRMAGNNYFFGTAMLKGLGMAFDTAILKKYGWPAHSVVEDVEFSIMLLEDKVPVHYNPAAIITSEMAVSRAQADGQRRPLGGGKVFVLPLRFCQGL